jgi:hypothetical protein
VPGAAQVAARGGGPGETALAAAATPAAALDLAGCTSCGGVVSVVGGAGPACRD